MSMQKKLVSAMFCLLLCASAAKSSNTVWVELMKAGKQAQEQGELQKAKKLLLSALRKAEESSDSGLQAQSLVWLARVNEEEGDWKTAELILRQAGDKAKVANVDPAVVESIKEELRKSLTKQGVAEPTANFLSEEPFTQPRRNRTIQDHPYQVALKAYESGEDKKAETILLSLIQESRAGNGTECLSDLYCLDLLYQIYARTDQFDKCEKLIESLLDDIKSRREDAINVSVFAGQYFLYLGALFEIRSRHEEAEVMMNKGLRIIASSSKNDVIERTINLWSSTGRKVEAQKLISCIKSESQTIGGDKKPVKARPGLKYAKVNFLKVDQQYGFWVSRFDGFHPAAAMAIRNTGPLDLSKKKLVFQAIFWNPKTREKQTVRKESVQELYRINQSLVLMFEGPVAQALPSNVHLWPEIQYKLMARVFVNDSPEVENLTLGQVSQICGTEEDALEKVRQFQGKIPELKKN